MSDKLRVRMLLRVSSKQQLDADGDLPTQRRIVENYIREQEGWELDNIKSEYHELGVSGYKNSVDDREILQEILTDAKKHEFQILVCYKDDRLGRREDEIPAYIKELADYRVLVYTVKEGCITPQSHVDNLMTFIRYWSAQGDSMKTAQRVKDAAMEQVRMGKNQGGNAPFGYRLELSGELSKHQRALKKKVIVEEEAEIVRKIFDYALNYSYGAQKIARLLNESTEYSGKARNGVWKAGTISDMLKNPIYTGYEAYNRRTHEGKAFRRLDPKEWILAERCNEEIKIIDLEVWQKVQQIREDRKEHYAGKRKCEKRIPASTSNSLSLLDVAYCGCCGRKLTNGSKYNYWTTKAGVKCSSVIGYYRCQSRQQGEGCKGKASYRADNLEPEVYEFVQGYLEQIEKNEEFLKKYQTTKAKERSEKKKRLQSLKRQLQESEKNQKTYEEKLPLVLRGDIKIPVEDYYKYIEKEKEKQEKILEEIEELQSELNNWEEVDDNLSKLMKEIPSWKDLFVKADMPTKRMIINKLIDRIDVWDNELKISVKINVESVLSRKNSGFPTTPYKPDSA